MTVTAALALTAPPTHASAVPEIRVIRAAPGVPAPRFLRLRFDVVDEGIAGTEELLVDGRTGRYVDRTRAGPLSESDGYDGVRTWSADSTGLAENDEDPDSRSAGLAWSYLIAGPPAVAPHAEPLAGGRGGTSLRLRYPALSRGLDVRFDRAGLLREAIVYGGSSAVRLTFDRYGRSGALLLPARIASRSKSFSSTALLRGVDVLAAVPPGAFARPPFPRDVSLSGVAVVPMRLRWFGPEIDMRIGEGPRLHVLVDTGSSYALSPRAARRSGLRLVGSGHTRGIGPNYVAERYAVAHRVRIGRAELRDQPVRGVRPR